PELLPLGRDAQCGDRPVLDPRLLRLHGGEEGLLDPVVPGQGGSPVATPAESPPGSPAPLPAGAALAILPRSRPPEGALMPAWARRAAVLALPLLPASAGAAERRADVVVYAATASGVIAAVAVAREGRTVLLVEPGKHVGGMVSGGLGATDHGNRAAIG